MLLRDYNGRVQVLCDLKRPPLSHNYETKEEKN
jgi:hypothetical protein